MASLTLLSCFSENSYAYNFSSNENMSLKLHIIIHFDTIFLGIQFFDLVEGILNLSKLQGGHLRIWCMVIEQIEVDGRRYKN